mmetsp:Transcript_45392/g.131026  ORF Transcript_45392/g.131026 Transcript_45392/m.131026 type:complete len:253 (+) Transcript_45392:342-1100(+)
MMCRNHLAADAKVEVEGRRCPGSCCTTRQGASGIIRSQVHVHCAAPAPTHQRRPLPLQQAAGEEHNSAAFPPREAAHLVAAIHHEVSLDRQIAKPSRGLRRHVAQLPLAVEFAATPLLAGGLRCSRGAPRRLRGLRRRVFLLLVAALADGQGVVRHRLAGRSAVRCRNLGLALERATSDGARGDLVSHRWLAQLGRRYARHHSVESHHRCRRRTPLRHLAQLRACGLRDALEGLHCARGEKKLFCPTDAREQ